MEFELDLLPFLVESFGVNRQIRGQIDALYQSDVFRFYSLARNHELYNHPIVKEGGLLQEEYSRKALGIILAAENDDKVYSALIKIISAGWSEVYSFIANRPRFNISSFMKYLGRKKGPIQDLSVDYINSCLIIGLVLANFFNKPFDDDVNLKKSLELLYRRWDFYSNPPSRISLDQASPEEKQDIESLLLSLGPVKDFTSFLDYHKKLGEIPSFLFDFEGVSSYSIFDEVTLSRRDLEEIVYSYLVTRDVILQFSQFELCFCYMLYIRYLIKAYKVVKEHYFANNRETVFFDFKQIEKDKDDLSRRLSATQNLLNKANETVDSLKREVSRLSKRIAELETGQAELQSLREFVFSLDRQEEFTPVDGPVDLSGVKGVVLGGHPRWQTKMRSLLPDFSFIPPDSLNFDQNIVRNADFLFVCVNYLNHAIYYRAMSAVITARVHFLRQANEELVVEEIKKFIKG